MAELISFPKKKRGCCEMLRREDGAVYWCEELPTKKVQYTPYDMVDGHLIQTNLSEIIEKFWCDAHAPDFAEPL
jgi:hypothetical protein